MPNASFGVRSVAALPLHPAAGVSPRGGRVPPSPSPGWISPPVRCSCGRAGERLPLKCLHFTRACLLLRGRGWGLPAHPAPWGGGFGGAAGCQPHAAAPPASPLAPGKLRGPPGLWGLGCGGVWGAGSAPMDVGGLWGGCGSWAEPLGSCGRGDNPGAVAVSCCSSWHCRGGWGRSWGCARSLGLGVPGGWGSLCHPHLAPGLPGRILPSSTGSEQFLGPLLSPGRVPAGCPRPLRAVQASPASLCSPAAPRHAPRPPRGLVPATWVPPPCPQPRRAPRGERRGKPAMKSGQKNLGERLPIKGLTPSEPGAPLPPCPKTAGAEARGECSGTGP